MRAWMADWSPHATFQVSATGLLRSWSERSAELFSWPLIAPGESSHLPALESDIQRFHQPLDFFFFFFSTNVYILQLAVQNTERQVCTFGFQLQITLMAELMQTFLTCLVVTSFCLGMPCKHIFPPSAMCVERAVTLSPAEIPMLF